MSIYCTYVTFYSGNKLPPFYIGSTLVDKIKNGYHGSVSSKKYKEIWKSELCNNPQLFVTKIIRTYHSRKEALENERNLHLKLQVNKNILYINMAIATKGVSGISMCGKDNPNFGKKHSEKTKQIISQTNKNRKHSLETKRKHRDKMLTGERYIKNFWEQVSKETRTKFKTYENYQKIILDEYETCLRIPKVISLKIGTPTKSIITILQRNNLPFVTDQKFTKLIVNYGARWRSYNEFVQEVMSLYHSGLSRNKISKILGINNWSVS